MVHAVATIRVSAAAELSAAAAAAGCDAVAATHVTRAHTIAVTKVSCAARPLLLSTAAAALPVCCALMIMQHSSCL